MARAKRSRPDRDITPTHPNAAAIDIGARMHVAAVAPDRDAEPVRSFGTFTGDLQRLADWLERCGVRTVAMESTGVYWIPVFEVLDQRGFDVVLVNARDAKHVPHRKTDVSDAQWLRQLHEYGLLRASFRPKGEVATLRPETGGRHGWGRQALSSRSATPPRPPPQAANLMVPCQCQAGQGSEALLQACPRSGAHPQPARGRHRPPQELSRCAARDEAEGRAVALRRHRRGRWLNNRVEQDHRRIKRLTRPMLGFQGFWTAKRTLAGIEAMSMLAKEQVRAVPKGDMPAQRSFV
jgi:hypothetical protein